MVLLSTRERGGAHSAKTILAQHVESGLRMRATTALVALHVSVALFGFAALFGKWIALSPVDIVFGRTVVAALTLFIVLRWTKRVTGSLSRGLILNGALLALHWVTFFAAIQIATVAIALLGFASFPVFVLILERALHGRRPALVEQSAVGIVVIGLALIVPEFSWMSRTVQGLAWGVASGFTFALLTLRNRALVPEVGATVLALWQNTFAALWLLPVLALTVHIAVPAARDVVLIILLGVFCTALAHTLFIASMLRISTHTASVVTILEPVYGIGWAALLLGERPDLRTAVGGTLIIGAAVLASWRKGGP
jgi:drug/metabolite transporter (DMT)-like permease